MTIHAVINALGGLRAYDVLSGDVEDHVELARRALLESKFSAPQLSSSVFEGVGNEGCVPWGQNVVLTYTFEDDGSRLVRLDQTFDDFATVAVADVEKLRAWNAAEGVVSSSATPGFSDPKPLRRPPPRFPKSASQKIYVAGATNPQVMHSSMRIDPDGKVRAALVLGDGEFSPHVASVALTALKNWRFEPARIDGTAIARTACQRISFGKTAKRG